MDPKVSKLLKEKKEIEIRLREIDEFLDLYRKLIGDIDDENPDPSTGDVPDEGAGKAARKPRKRVKTAEIASAAEGVIRAAGRPLTRAEIVEELEAIGFKLNSSDKPRYIGTILWRNQPRFIYLEGRGYAVDGVPGYPKDDDTPSRVASELFS